jgi:hypothetical protein
MRIDHVPIAGGNVEAQAATIAAIGNAIKRGSEYLPLRNLAAALASKAGPKDYLGQVKQIWQYMITHWRYVRDPQGKELLTHGPEAIFRFVLGGDRIGVGAGKGAGDCDCCAAGAGSLLRAIGFSQKICVVAPKGARAGRTFTHVFLRVQVPQFGWLSFDPVGYPRHGLGWTQPHSRIACYDLDGRRTAAQGNFALEGDNKEVIDMETGRMPDLAFHRDYGLAGTDEQEPRDFRAYAGKYFGPALGPVIDGIGLGGLAAEVDVDIVDGTPIARTPLLSISPQDARYIRVMGEPKHGTIALGDDGSIYEYDGTIGAGFFKRLFRRVKKGFRKLVKGIKGVIKKLPGGRYLVKLGEKLHAIAMKVVRPLIKFVGKYASKLAPIAALIPGYGPAIAGALFAAGKVAKLMQKFDVATVGKKGSVRRLSFGDPKKAHAFKAELHKEALQAALRMKAKRAARVATVKARRAPPPMVARPAARPAAPTTVVRRAASVIAARGMV